MSESTTVDEMHPSRVRWNEWFARAKVQRARSARRAVAGMAMTAFLCGATVFVLDRGGPFAWVMAIGLTLALSVVTAFYLSLSRHFQRFDDESKASFEREMELALGRLEQARREVEETRREGEEARREMEAFERAQGVAASSVDGASPLNSH